ncbi:MAG TPA: NUDIX hydrolase [Polyangia bacterium]
MADRIVAETKFLRLIEREGWYFVERPNSKGVVTILPFTRERKLILVEQLRAPLRRKVIEFPAGLMGDEAGHEKEDPLVAASRELVEETGYQARDLELIATTATSPGMANEMVHFVLAWNLDRLGPGGGVDGENIVVHEVPITEARAWLRQQERNGLVIAAKVFAGLYFANERWGGA